MTIKQFIGEAKKRYPTGSFVYGLPYTYLANKDKGVIDWKFIEEYIKDNIYISKNEGIFIRIKELNSRICVYKDGNWAVNRDQELIDIKKWLYDTR